MPIFYKHEAVKNLQKINKNDLTKIRKKIIALSKNPLLGKPLQGRLSGLLSLRAWPLRIIYTYDSKSKTIEIITIDYRGSVYKK
jgi:mRNA-degrading endonuclease RelE of RelBE toxin-antitoxin system